MERKTCLSISDPCNQYYCGKQTADNLKTISPFSFYRGDFSIDLSLYSVSEGKYCSDLQLDPVCDSDNNQHPNLCSLQFNRKSLAYRGFCKVSKASTAISKCNSGHKFLLTLLLRAF